MGDGGNIEREREGLEKEGWIQRGCRERKLIGFGEKKRDEVVRRKEEKRVRWKEKTERIEEKRVIVRQKLRGGRKRLMNENCKDLEGRKKGRTGDGGREKTK